MGAAERSLLFVVSNDFGELSIALGFVDGYAFRTTLLLPDRVLAVNRDALPVPAARWASADEVLARAAADDADVVVLCSAYLYAFNGLLDLAGVERLVAALRAGGRRVVTTDPFLGLLARPDAALFRPGHPRAAWLAEHFGRLAGVLRDVPHLYPVEVTVPGLTTLAFFNPHAARDVAAPGPRWMFVLSSEDCVRQAARFGRERFEALLLARLEDTARAGREAVVVAPAPVLDSLRPRTASIERLTLVPFASHRRFTTLLLEAEHVFYWNVVSNSIPRRVLNGRSVFLFDAGHLVHAIPALADLALTLYWGGVAPTVLDPAAPLDAARLAALADEQRAALEPPRERWRRATRPDVLVDRLIAGSAAR